MGGGAVGGGSVGTAFGPGGGGQPARAPRVVVIGGYVVDCIVETPVLPGWGDDLLVDAVRTRPGGKGLNQAVALARLGAQAGAVGVVGDDAVGHGLRAALEGEGVDLGPLAVRPGAATPMCVVLTHPDGRTAFCWRVATELLLTGADVRAAVDEVAAADAVLLTFDSPPETVGVAIELAHGQGVPVVVNPAPPPADPAGMAALPWAKVSLATPNEKEARLLLAAAGGTGPTGPRRPGTVPPRDRAGAVAEAAATGPAERLAEAFAVTFGVPVVCVTLSERGCVLYDGAGSRCYPAHPTTVVDTTAASDAFTAALTFGLLVGGGLGAVSEVAVQRALAAAAWTVARPGAFDALPTAVDLD